MFPCASYCFHTMKNKITYLNRLHPYYMIMEGPNAELIEALSKKNVPVDRGEEVEGLPECCVVQLFLESYQSMCLERDFHG